jgi:predicted Zn-ribbon and HTH transcriptional regulator
MSNLNPGRYVMKNTIYAVVIAVCILGAVLVFLHRRSASSTGIDSIPDTKMLWVKCAKCGQGYEMGEKQYYKEVDEKARANTSGMPITMPLTCQKCGQDAVRKAFKCAKCGEVFFAYSVPADFEDRCPKCKHSAIEDGRNARKSGASQ